VRIAWLSYLDSWAFHGGGELNAQGLIAAGRERGHTITEAPFLRRRAQRALRRSRLHRRVSVDWDADVFVLANIRNLPALKLPYPAETIDRVLSTGRAAVLQDAWVDVCELDVPCGGDASRCPAACQRAWSNDLFARAAISIFLSPMHRDISAAVLDVPLPSPILSEPYIDPERFRPLGLDRDIDVLYVGTIKRAKGYYALLERFGPDRLTLVGPLAIDEPVKGNYLGEIPHAELPAIYNRARTFAHLPEWHEPLGRTVIEAALCGCEIVANDRVGAMSYGPATRSDRSIVRTARDRFWRDFERAVEGQTGPGRRPIQR
jgi:glycosyltransferase involved in cell wall biosynthesis